MSWSTSRPDGRALLAALALAAGCDDPVREDAIAALGPEDPDVAEGPLHRPGQPCLACHDGDRDGVRAFSVAGTILWTAESGEPARGVVVELLDAAGVRHEAATNCAGNFFVEPADFTPVYPLWAAVIAGDLRIAMDSPIGGDGSCASCHQGEESPDALGPVFVQSVARPQPEDTCP